MEKNGTCDQCGEALIEIDHYGQHRSAIDGAGGIATASSWNCPKTISRR